MKYLLLSFILCSLSAFAQDYSDVKEFLDTSFFDDRSDNPLGVGMVVRKDGQTIYRRCEGLANREKKIAFDENTVVGIASISKQFTALCIRILEFEGRLKVSDPISTYLPELPNYKDTIRIEHLLSHTSGIRDHIELLGLTHNQKEKFYTVKGMFLKLKEFNQLSFSPGTDFAYSNTGYILLGEIVKRVSGESLEAFAKRRIFDPLSMTKTEFTQFRKYKEFGYTRPYNYHRGKKKFKGLRTEEINALGATGVYTTLNDLEKWDEQWRLNILQLDRSIIRKMNTSYVLKDGRSVAYNNGQKFRDYRGVALIEHAGGWAYFNTQYTRIDSEGLSFIAVSNNTYDYCIGMVEKTINFLYPVQKPLSKKTEFPEQFVGFYYSNNGVIREVSTDSIGQLVLNGTRMIRGKADTLGLVDGACYQNELTPELCFLLPRGGNPGFTFSGSTYFQLQRFYEKQTDTTLVLKEGSYFSEEIGKVKICYKKRNKKYYIKIAKAAKRPMLKLTNNLYTADRNGFVIEVVKDGIILANKRVFKLKCIKEEE